MIPGNSTGQTRSFRRNASEFELTHSVTHSHTNVDQSSISTLLYASMKAGCICLVYLGQYKRNDTGKGCLIASHYEKGPNPELGQASSGSCKCHNGLKMRAHF